MQFSIQPKKDIPLKTVIRNRANIYFDYNSPIVTNETFHEVDKESDEILIRETGIVLNSPGETAANQEIYLYPNPATSEIWLRMDQYVNKGLFSLTNVQNIELLNIPFEGTNVNFENINIQPGLYIYTIKTEKGNKTGKLIIY